MHNFLLVLLTSFVAVPSKNQNASVQAHDPPATLPLLNPKMKLYKIPPPNRSHVGQQQGASGRRKFAIKSASGRRPLTGGRVVQKDEKQRVSVDVILTHYYG